MEELFEQSEDMINNLFGHLSNMFDPVKNAEIIRLAEIEAEIKKIENETLKPE